MEERIIKFIAALRSSRARISIAESQDAWRAIEHLGIADRERFRLSLRSTLIKDARHLSLFDELFPQFFDAETSPLVNIMDKLDSGDQQTLRDLLDQAPKDIRQLLEWLLYGQSPTQEDLDQLADRTNLAAMPPSPYSTRQAMRRMQQVLGWEQLQEQLEMLRLHLTTTELDPKTIDQLTQLVSENMAHLLHQLGIFAGHRIQENAFKESQRREPRIDLLDRSFNSLSPQEMEILRENIRRLAQRLRTQVSLRQKRGKQGKLDPKKTLRANLRYSGVPFEMHYKEHRLRPRLVLILDVSTSMRPVAEFFLRMIYELQDQVQKTRSFAFIDHLEDVSLDMDKQIDEAVNTVLTKLPSGHYNTDLGYSLQQFAEYYLDTVDSRTTVILLGDARNNYNYPNVETFKIIGRRARKILWINPEHPSRWGTGDSDMLVYAPVCQAVFQVRNLAQLVEAVDAILT